ncbi:inositol monophosphatase family protein [Streptomyces sp. NPDC006552]|uniref:inositol monophosphatase family protein n=1 Tax=Streptomyces sp. NPDC006552 TaxID=3157179 RepID=UPI00339F8C73
MNRDHPLLPCAEEAAAAATAWLDRAGRRLSATRYKPTGEEVTDADLGVQSLVTDLLRARTPDIPLVGEEAAAPAGAGPERALPSRCWVLDPIDGTMNFARGAPFYSVSLALVDGGRPVLGVIDAPALGRRWSTRGPTTQDGTPSEVRHLSDAVVGLTGTGSGDPAVTASFVGRLHADAYRVRMLGAMSMDLVGVAEGWLDACVCLAPKPWDVAAGIALVQDRGGVVLGARGAGFSWDSPLLAAGAAELAHDLIDLWTATSAST